ncbi:hypothetical protein ACFS5J_06525 [Flavobacterium chuncheonense]|uniref:DUF4843 domain-containing protein n=1 Tax=Flavobacterium chuncheonense TaxID=2026653 RepID=A0ABW5YKY1_9FLAO
MKKIIALLLFANLSLLTSCSDADPEIYNGETLAYYTDGVSSKFPVKEDDTNGSQKLIQVGVTTSSTADRSFQIEILADDDLTDDIVYADPSQYTIDQASLVIPANSFLGEIKMIALYDDMPAEGSVFVKLKLTQIDGGSILQDDNIYTVELFRSCLIENFPNSFTGFPFAFGESAPSFQVNFIPVSGLENTFTIASAWGPNFVAWATGDSSYAGQFPYAGTLIINCDNTVEVIGADSWATGGTGSYDAVSGQIVVELTQALFSSPFTVVTTFVPNP